MLLLFTQMLFQNPCDFFCGKEKVKIILVIFVYVIQVNKEVYTHIIVSSLNNPRR